MCIKTAGGNTNAYNHHTGLVMLQFLTPISRPLCKVNTPFKSVRAITPKSKACRHILLIIVYLSHFVEIQVYHHHFELLYTHRIIMMKHLTQYLQIFSNTKKTSIPPPSSPLHNHHAPAAPAIPSKSCAIP